MNTEAEIKISHSNVPLIEADYHETPLDMSEFIKIEIQLKFGKPS